METNKELKRLALAAVFTAISISIDVFFKYALGLPNFGVPFYAIPIIFGSMLLGPVYGVLMSVIGDAVGVFLSGYGYLPLFVLAPIFWGLVPGLLMRHSQKNWARLAVMIFVTYVLATLANTYAIYDYYGLASAKATLYVRVGLIPFNTILMFFIIKELQVKLKPVSDKFINPSLQSDKS